MKRLARLGPCLLLGCFLLLPATACTSGGVGGDGPGAAGNSALPAGASAGNGSLASSGSPALGSAGSTGSGAAPSIGPAAGSGGVSNAGGSTGSGSQSIAACTDAPPNNGDTCAHAVEYGWCTQSWIGSSCQQSCGKCTGSTGSGGTTGSAGSPGSTGNAGAGYGAAGAPPALVGGSNGWATRYWDCCKPACGWKGNVPGGSNPVSSCSVSNQSFGGDYDKASACPNGSNGPAFMCQNFGPWAVNDALSYGFAAVNKGSDYCGKCYELQFSGTSHNSSNDAGSQSLSGKTMIVQAINNGGVDADQFDLLIPGGGVGEFNACATQWGTSDLGEQYGGFFLACQKANGYDYAKSKACAADKCSSVFTGKPELLASCNWFVTWFGAPDNPALMYKEVSCPSAITSLSGLHR